MSALDHLAFWIGSVGGSGLLRPAPGTWGSFPGFLYFLWWRTLPGVWLPWTVAAAGLLLSVWSAGRCERILGKKDPGTVVIDEAACVPLALWPIAHIHPSWLVWAALFAAYRIFDIVKPFPARQLEAVGGGLGITLDDCASSALMGLGLWLLLHYGLFPA